MEQIPTAVSSQLVSIPKIIITSSLAEAKAIEYLGMKYIRVVFGDLNGAVKGKLIPADEYAADKKYGMPRSVLIQDIEGEESHSIEGFTPESGDTDMFLVADRTTHAPAPGNDELEQVVADIVDENGRAFPQVPRTILKSSIASLAELGYEAKVASELEFYVTKPDGSLFDQHELEQPYSDINALDKLGGLLNELVSGAAAIGLKPEAVLSESGPGQMEINVAPDSPLIMADRTLLFKQMIREVARRAGQKATFLSKPFAEHAGSGFHLHLSLWKDGKNVFTDPKVLETFTAGIIAFSHDIYALLAPNPNSYRRISLSHGYVPTNPSYGEDDRRVAYRFVGENESRRLENRVAGSDANPYLLLAAMLGAGARGLRDSLTFESEIVKTAIDTPFVDNLPEAINSLTNSDFAKEVLSPEFVTAFTAIKRIEWGKFQAQITPWEHDTYGSQV